MKILQVIQYFSPKRGGTVNYVYNLVKQLLKKDHEVTIFTTDDAYDADYADLVAPAKVVAFPSKLGFLRYSPEMKTALEREIVDFDVVHMNNYWSYQNIIAANAAIKNNVPYILSPHGSLPIMMKGYGRKYLFEAMFGKKIIKNASRIIAVSNMESDQVKQHNIDPQKVTVIPNAVDLDSIKFHDKGQFRRKYNISEEEKIILFLGRIHPIKGIDLLIQAFHDLLKHVSNVKLVIVGPDEEYLDQIKTQIDSLHIRDHVIFTGPLYDEDKFSALRDADIYVLPSRYEIFAISVLEACACGTPVIVTKNQGVASYIKGRAGEVIPFDHEELSKAMEKLLVNEELRKKYGENGEKMVKELFAWERIIDRYEQVYRKVANK